MVTIKVKVLTTFLRRMRGLLGTSLGKCMPLPVLLKPCASIHTFGMRYAIDVAFLDKNNQVMLSYKGIAPGNVVTCKEAASVLERPSSEEVWPKLGQVLTITANQANMKGEIAYVKF